MRIEEWFITFGIDLWHYAFIVPDSTEGLDFGDVIFASHERLWYRHHTYMQLDVLADQIHLSKYIKSDL